MIRTIVLATSASAQPMGQQAYEEALASGLVAPGRLGPTLERRVVRSVRSRVAGNVRLPLRLVHRSHAAARVASSWAYRGADVVHRCDLRLPPSKHPDREVVTIHDLAFELFPDEGQVSTYAAEAVRRSRVVIAPSEFTAEQLRDRWRLADVRVIPNGIDRTFAFREELSRADRAALGVTGPFVLHAGGCTKRKNLSALAAAWAKLAPHLPKVTLVLAGPPNPDRDVLFAGLPGTALVGRLPRDLHIRAVQGADAVVVPSLYEGFGLPAAEAMLAGTPVVAADCASLPEVCGDAALLVPPTADGLASGLEAVLTDAALARRLREAGPRRARTFSWDVAVAAHVALYEEVLDEPTATSA